MNEKRPIKITDVTLRDGHQSLFATRMTTEDMLPLAARMNDLGLWSMEVWGGATFDVTHRFLNEDPWERLRTLRKLLPDVKLQMLLRGQNLVGYRNYADDVVAAFVERAAANGIDVFRVFDALNDERNFEAAAAAIKKAGKHFQGAISYSLTERRLGGDTFNLDYYVQMGRALEAMGADSVAIKDMAGILSPFDAFDLVSALKAAVKIPVHVHTHYASGMASMACLKAIEAGADGIDTALAPFALRSSHPALEPFLVTLAGTPWDPGISLDRLTELDAYLETLVPKYLQFADATRFSVIDIGVLEHQIPGGMISNMVLQLKQSNALHRLPEVFAEIQTTRKDLGMPPLVTPTSQIVGAQSAINVIAGRYKMISREVKDYCAGLYGKPPHAIDPAVQALALKNYKRVPEPITVRPGAILEPELPKAFEAVKDLTDQLEDVLIYALYPATGLEFLKKKYGKV